MMYNPAFDPFNGIFRMLYILKHLEGESYVEVDRLRIFDFYLLFPYLAYKIRMKKQESELIELRKKLVTTKKPNPYNMASHPRRLFEQLRPYQMIALSHMASYGLIDPRQLLREQRVVVADKERMKQVMTQLEPMPPHEESVIQWLNLCFRTTPLRGTYGLKYRTQLMEYKYDGC